MWAGQESEPIAREALQATMSTQQPSARASTRIRQPRTWQPQSGACVSMAAAMCAVVCLCDAQPRTFTPVQWDATVFLDMEARGERRQYHVLLPHDRKAEAETAAHGPLPSILMLHGAFSNASVQASGQTLTQPALLSGYVVLHTHAAI